MAIWVRLLSVKHISVNGLQKTFQPYDWVEVGKQTAQAWLAAGEADVPDYASVREGMFPVDAGAIVRGVVPHWLTELLGSEQTQTGGASSAIPYLYTMYWDTDLRLRRELIAAGMGVLANPLARTSWQLAVPLCDYKTLAVHVGTEAERTQTQAVIRDLRVPVYDTRLMFVRRCEDTQALMNEWDIEREQWRGGDDRLALARALYAVKPLILALPASWANGEPQSPAGVR